MKLNIIKQNIKNVTNSKRKKEVANLEHPHDMGYFDAIRNGVNYSGNN